MFMTPPALSGGIAVRRQRDSVTEADDAGGGTRHDRPALLRVLDRLPPGINSPSCRRTDAQNERRRQHLTTGQTTHAVRKSQRPTFRAAADTLESAAEGVARARRALARPGNADRRSGRAAGRARSSRRCPDPKSSTSFLDFGQRPPPLWTTSEHSRLLRLLQDAPAPSSARPGRRPSR
jgi:hypothetical protein